MPCHWLVKGTKKFCTRSIKNEFCANHAFAIRNGSSPPLPCRNCGNGTNSLVQLCIPCGQAKETSKLWRKRKLVPIM